MLRLFLAENPWSKSERRLKVSGSVRAELEEKGLDYGEGKNFRT